MNTKKSNLYTKTGDKGTTSLVGGKRVSKADARVEAYGTADELNSCLGLLREIIADENDRQFILAQQHRLFVLGSYLATDTSGEKPGLIISKKSLEEMENEIDRIDALLPVLHAFVIPGGCKAAALCNICRTVCRRMERAMARVATENEIDPIAASFANRLSDYLFVLSRKLNNDHGANEIFWDKSCL